MCIMCEGLHACVTTSVRFLPNTVQRWSCMRPQSAAEIGWPCVQSIRLYLESSNCVTPTHRSHTGTDHSSTAVPPKPTITSDSDSDKSHSNGNKRTSAKKIKRRATATEALDCMVLYLFCRRFLSSTTPLVFSSSVTRRSLSTVASLKDFADSPSWVRSCSACTWIHVRRPRERYI